MNQAKILPMIEVAGGATGAATWGAGATGAGCCGVMPLTAAS